MHSPIGSPGLREVARTGYTRAREVYRTQVVPGADIVVLNAYPKDTEFVQAETAFDVTGSDPRRLLKDEGSTTVVTTASTEGMGFHSLLGPGMPLFAPFDNLLPPQALEGIETWVYSPNLSVPEIRKMFKAPVRSLYNDWKGLMNDLESRHSGPAVKVAIYPLASMQMGD